MIHYLNERIQDRGKFGDDISKLIALMIIERQKIFPIKISFDNILFYNFIDVTSIVSFDN